MGAYTDADATIKALVDGKSQADAEKLMHSLFKATYDESYATLRSNLESHGKIPAEIAPVLYRLLSDDALIGESSDMTLPDVGQEKTFTLSKMLRILQKNKDYGTRLKSAKNIDDLNKVVSDFSVNNQSTELDSRAQVVLKKKHMSKRRISLRF